MKIIKQADLRRKSPKDSKIKTLLFEGKLFMFYNVIKVIYNPNMDSVNLIGDNYVFI